MATNAEIAAALSGLNISPLDNPYGLGANTIAKALPNLYNPYASVGTNIGVTLGGALLAGLLGYQAKKQATEASLVANQYATQMLAKTPEERLGLIQNLPEDVSSRTQIQNALLGLNTQLLGQQNALDLLGGQEVAKQKALAGYYATPEGQGAFEKELERIRAESEARYAGLGMGRGGASGLKPKAPTFWDAIPAADKTKIATSKGQTEAIRRLADRFESLGGNALTLQARANVNPNSEENLAMANMNILVPSTARLLGEVGNLAESEQQRLIDATLGSKISGPKAIAARLRLLADEAENIINLKVGGYKAAYESGGEALLPGAPEDATLEQLMNELNQLKLQRQQLEQQP